MIQLHLNAFKASKFMSRCHFFFEFKLQFKKKMSGQADFNISLCYKLIKLS